MYSGTDLRPSVRISSQTTIQYGLLILDAAHLPYGEGTWPAFWLLGADGNWPDSGEIDIYEGVGDSLQNTVSYHTSAGCSYQPDPDQTGELNTAVGTDCNALANNDEACGNTDPSTTSFGSGASSNGGSVYAIEWTSDFIKVRVFLNSVLLHTYQRLIIFRLGISIDLMSLLTSPMIHLIPAVGEDLSLI